MLDVEVIQKRLTGQQTVEAFGKSYEVKNCVKIVEPELVKICMVLVSGDSELSVSIDVREYKLEGAKHV